MDDYLSEKEQWEAIKAWLRDNGLWIIAGVAIGAAILGGWHWYQRRVDESGAQASTKYNEIMQAFGRNDASQALVSLGELERQYPASPYVDQAKLAAARSYVESNQLDKAATELQAVADHSKDSDLALVARLRLARVQIAQQKPDVALTTLNATKPGAFVSRYHEILGDAYYSKGDKTNALKEYLSAKSADLGARPGDDQLDLKITDLSASSGGTPTAATPSAPATAPVPGKPVAASAPSTSTPAATTAVSK